MHGHLETTQSNITLTREDQDAIRAVLQGVPEVEEVIVFGSRALGSAKQGSDVDLALKGSGVTRDTVMHVRALLADIPLVPYFFDVVHYDTIENVALREHIDTHGVSLYRRG